MHMKHLEQTTPWRQEISSGLLRPGAGPPAGVTANGCRVSFWNEEKLLEIDSNDGYTTL